MGKKTRKRKKKKREETEGGERYDKNCLVLFYFLCFYFVKFMDCFTELVVLKEI
jgi:hypothetical protein